ncbi:MAG: xylulokinase [Anaerolineae bacterium]|nr:xylulokinase [Anaerolineae bacterium]MDW8100009.1 xylulokinase [Anaerolineae bacterium]
MKMDLILSLDLGTTSLKALLVDAEGAIHAQAEREYPIYTPQPGWAEQDPQDWWQAAVSATRACLAVTDATAVRAIGLSGQMHGTVLLDADGTPLMPAVIWADQRGSAQATAITAHLGSARLAEIAGSRVAAGFMAATLLWIQQERPDVWTRIRSVLLPKDWLRWRLTGHLATEVSDASGTTLMDIRCRSWSAEILTALGIDHAIMPPILESGDIAGELIGEAAAALGLPAGVPVVAGGADQATGALGSGVVEPDTLLMSLGTGGQLVLPLSEVVVDRQLRAHTFCHALPQRWYLLGAILSAGLAFRWLRDAVLEFDPANGYERMTALAEAVPPGAEGLLWVPHLVGERTPYMDPDARGVLVGLTLRHGRAHLVRAMMEGIALNLRNAFEVFHELGVSPQRIVMAGGGARSPLWRQIVADVFQREVIPLQVEAQSALGAAILAGAAVGLLPDAITASRQWARYGAPVTPNPANAAVYATLFDLFRSMHPRHQADFVRLKRLSLESS